MSMKIKKPRQVLLNRSVRGNVAVIIVLILFGIMFAFPMVLALINSIKPIEELMIFPPRLYATNPTFDNYKDLFTIAANTSIPMLRSLANSVFIALAQTILTIVIGTAAAFPLALGNFPGKKFIFGIIVTSLLFVAEVTSAPQYVLISKLHLLDSYWAIILPAAGASMGVFLMKQFMEQIPYAVVEAAKIDGCTEYSILTRIIVPLVKPAWMTLAIFIFPGAWTNSGGTFIFTDNLKLLPTLLSEISAGAGVARMGVSAATMVLMLLPSLIFFIIAQSNVLETMASAGIKE